jgi:YVTN family beta-propeller protein
MKSSRIYLSVFCICLLCVTLMTGCDGASAAGGFTVTTSDVLEVAGDPNFSVFPHPNIPVTGTWSSDDSGATGNVRSFSVVTDSNGSASVAGGRVPAIWDSTVFWDQPCGGQTQASDSFNVTTGVLPWACVHTIVSSIALPSFSFTSPAPSTLTIQTPGGFTTTSGMPVLHVYDRFPNLVATSTATSVSTDGTSATFPFPVTSAGTTLGSGLYGMNVFNHSSSTTLREVGAAFMSIGLLDLSHSAPYGVDATDITRHVFFCQIVSGRKFCSNGSSTTNEPIVTLANTAQLLYQGHLITVGNNPVAVKAYAPATTVTTSNTSNTTETISTTSPGRAITANFTDNTVSIVNLQTSSVMATIAVGSEPAALLVTPDNSKAFVANYGSGTISAIDLSTLAQTGTVNVGAQPDTLAFDPSGTALWVGGQGYMSEVDLSTLAILRTISTSGLVTSMAVSASRNEIVSTVIGNLSTRTTSSGGTVADVITTQSTIGIRETSLASNATVASYSTGSTANALLAANQNPSLPSTLLGSSTVVSKNYGNGLAISATPGGFVVIDLTTHTQFLSGTTSSPVRAIATDPTQGVVYMTAPDSNSLITVDLPKVQPTT